MTSESIEIGRCAGVDAASAAPARPARSMSRNATWNFAGNATYAACQWGMLVVLSKLGTAAMVGRLVLAVAVCAPVFALCNLALRGVLATDAKEEFRFTEYLRLRLLTTAGALVVVAGIAIVGWRWEVAAVILAFAAAKGLDAVSDVFHGLFWQHERLDYVAQSLLLKGPLSLAALAVGVVWTGSLMGGVVGVGVAYGLVLMGYDLRRGRAVRAEGSHPAGARGQIEAARLRQLAFLAFPLGLAWTLAALNRSVPRYFIEGRCGEAELGVFGAIAALMIAGDTVMQAVGNAASPRLATYYASGNAGGFRRLLLRLAAAGTLVGLGGVAVAVVGGGPLLAWLYRPEYAKHASLFVALMIVGAIGYADVYLAYGMLSARYLRPQPALSAGGVAITGVVCWLLVPRHGLMGAVIAMGVSGLVQAGGKLCCTLHALGALRAASPRRKDAETG